VRVYCPCCCPAFNLHFSRLGFYFPSRFRYSRLVDGPTNQAALFDPQELKLSNHDSDNASMGTEMEERSTTSKSQSQNSNPDVLLLRLHVGWFDRLWPGSFLVAPCCELTCVSVLTGLRGLQHGDEIRCRYCSDYRVCFIGTVTPLQVWTERSNLLKMSTWYTARLGQHMLDSE